MCIFEDIEKVSVPVPRSHDKLARTMLENIASRLSLHGFPQPFTPMVRALVDEIAVQIGKQREMNCSDCADKRLIIDRLVDELNKTIRDGSRASDNDWRREVVDALGVPDVAHVVQAIASLKERSQCLSDVADALGLGRGARSEAVLKQAKDVYAAVFLRNDAADKAWRAREEALVRAEELEERLEAERAASGADLDDQTRIFREAIRADATVKIEFPKCICKIHYSDHGAVNVKEVVEGCLVHGGTRK
jgi:hypothetical protein